jgi:hypothetical protein
VLFEDADVGVCLEMTEGDGWLGSESYRAVAREGRSEQTLIGSSYGGDFEAHRLPDGTLVVASSWVLAMRVDARTWMKLNVNGETRAAPRWRDALRWMVANPRFWIDGRIRAAVDLVELGDPEGADWVARFGAAPEVSRQSRDVLRAASARRAPGAGR